MMWYNNGQADETKLVIVILGATVENMYRCIAIIIMHSQRNGDLK